VDSLPQILENAKSQLLSLPGCTGVAIGYKEVAGELIDQLTIIVFVEKKRLDVSEAERVPSEIDGAPVDVIERSFGLELTATDPFARFAQVFGGISITPRDVPPPWGTFGCVINTTGNAHVPAGDYLLTNQYVLSYADPNNPNSTTRCVLQPGRTDEPAPANYSCADYTYGEKTLVSVCAVATIVYGRTWANEVPNHPWHSGRRTLRGVAAPAVGDEVYKYGATTQNTRGVIRYIHSNDPVLPIQDAVYIEAPN
tara:strand:- start:209 stop:970 length:762 start_codon:yes stop_codon:yes gene_type:complete